MPLLQARGHALHLPSRLTLADLAPLSHARRPGAGTAFRFLQPTDDWTIVSLQARRPWAWNPRLGNPRRALTRPARIRRNHTETGSSSDPARDPGGTAKRRGEIG